MALVALDGGLLVPIGGDFLLNPVSAPAALTTTLDAAKEAIIYIGRVVTSDGGSHTINTTGSSSLGWRTGSVTFANGSTIVKVGLADVLATAGPPARATHAADVITFDVEASHTGGGGGITGDAWVTSVPGTGTKTIANGDLVAFAVQMTARGGVDSVIVNNIGVVSNRPTTTGYTGGSYAAQNGPPNCIITFSDGALGYFHGGIVFSSINTRTWNSGDATKEYGQLFKLPFQTKVFGVYGMVAASADFDVVLYSDPLGTPAAAKTVSIDSNVVSIATGRRFHELFSTPYTTNANQNIAVVFKPGGSNISAYYKTIANATHRVSDPWGTNGYGISRASGAFSDANSSLDHYYIGLIVGAFEHGVWPSGQLGG